MNKNFARATAALAILIPLLLCGCEQDEKESKSISSSVSSYSYRATAKNDSSSFSRTQKTASEILAESYSQEQIDEQKQYAMENVFPQYYDDLTDSDGDGLIDSAEEEAETDPQNADTDGDGADDFCELFLLGSNPLVSD